MRPTHRSICAQVPKPAFLGRRGCDDEEEHKKKKAKK
jgi:hypothetical protein